MSLSLFEGDVHSGKANTHIVANNNFILTGLSSFRHAEPCQRLSHRGFYQGLAQTLIGSFLSKDTISALLGTLCHLADAAQLSRRFDVVESVASFLRFSPLTNPLGNIGEYYGAMSLSRSTQGDVTAANTLFERVSFYAPSMYRAKAMLAIGTNSVAVGEHRIGQYAYREALRMTDLDHVFDPLTRYFANRMLAIIRSFEGDRRGALSDLEKLFPLARMASVEQPYAYYDYLNALSVELTEAGRLEEARNAGGAK